MNTKFLVFGILILSVFLAGCPEETAYASMRSDGQPYSGEGPFDDPNTTYYDAGNQEYNNGNEEACGKLNEPCCKSIGTDMYGMLSAQNYCNDYLDCRMDVCVEGPEYTAYDRTENY
ncbi:MAG: hypothetical protein COT90_04480 [Candidatus Diapherotrites archaeon CG10_big_fil_rev_8_21_14_0_10_31_34]|nr:MAG: hypothetical protein COT90_04480 [Candidatus Diapherotrites archaeon CG10_big_fil_rev_8_21_14_0_10_31_34]PJA16516.1 MAG: hypothetical protein COX63_03315 [Candidatus Diapherotrites archaeon CG_4_10_14_0_2_um_filter_31_5]